MKVSRIAVSLVAVTIIAVCYGCKTADLADSKEAKMVTQNAPSEQNDRKGARLVNLKQPPLETTMIGVLKGVSDYHGLGLSEPMVFGLSGHAFLINIHFELCPSGPYVWKRETVDPLIENMGMRMTDLGFFGSVADGEARKRVESQLREALDAGIPCSLINLENQIIDGYDETGFFTTQPWAPHNPFPPARLTFGTWDEFGGEFHVNFYTIEKVNPIERVAAILASLDYAIDMHRHPTKYSTEAYGVGPIAYDNWIRAVPTSGSSHGNWWNATVWSESRLMAAKYFVEIGKENKGVSGLCLKLKNRYLNIGGNLGKISSKEMGSQEKIELLKETKRWEAEAIKDVEKLSAALRSGSGQEQTAMEEGDADPVMMDKDDMHFLGMAGREGDQPGEGWLGDHVVFKLFFPNIAKFEPYRDGEGLYGIPHKGYWFGLQTRKLAGVPEDLPEKAARMTAPSQRYAVFITTPKALGDDANAMVETWFASQKDYVRRANAFEIEYYPPTSRGAEEPIELWIPVKKVDE
ncbi:MAG: hypothetical protein V3S89_06645 [Desulfobacterales bacterium]